MLIGEYHQYDQYHNQERENDKPFWHLDEAIGEGDFFGQQTTIRLKAHVSEERYHSSEGTEIIPLRANSGTRIYVMARPYILEPDYRINIGLYQQPTREGAIGEVTSSEWTGMHQRELGYAQAWLYPQERTLILWECLLEHWYRKEDPRTDETLNAVWLGFERFLLQHLPQVERIATPSWEPLYDEDKQAWPQFLEGLGYARIGARALGKDV